MRHVPSRSAARALKTPVPFPRRHGRRRPRSRVLDSQVSPQGMRPGSMAGDPAGSAGGRCGRAPPPRPASAGPGAAPMARRDDAPRDLLFGLLALQNGMVTRDQLVLAFATWTAAPGRLLADLLAEQGALHPEHRPILDALAEAHLKLHGGDPEKSLAALELSPSTRESLANAGGPEVEATLAHVFSGTGANDDADRTSTYAVGTATSGGQRFRILRPHAR